MEQSISKKGYNPATEGEKAPAQRAKRNPKSIRLSEAEWLNLKEWTAGHLYLVDAAFKSKVDKTTYRNIMLRGRGTPANIAKILKAYKADKIAKSQTV